MAKNGNAADEALGAVDRIDDPAAPLPRPARRTPRRGCRTRGTPRAAPRRRAARPRGRRPVTGDAIGLALDLQARCGSSRSATSPAALAAAIATSSRRSMRRLYPPAAATGTPTARSGSAGTPRRSAAPAAPRPGGQPATTMSPASQREHLRHPAACRAQRQRPASIRSRPRDCGWRMCAKGPPRTSGGDPDRAARRSRSRPRRHPSSGRGPQRAGRRPSTASGAAINGPWPCRRDASPPRDRVSTNARAGAVPRPGPLARPRAARLCRRRRPHAHTRADASATTPDTRASTPCSPRRTRRAGTSTATSTGRMPVERRRSAGRVRLGRVRHDADVPGAARAR